MGTSLPAPGAWEINPGHTDVAFIGRRFMVTKIRGTFTDVTGTASSPHTSTTPRSRSPINMTSVGSGSQARDTHVKSPEPFDVEQFPTATFRSSTVDWRGISGALHGDLTIHGVTRPVDLAVTFEGYLGDPGEATEASSRQALRSTERTSASLGTSPCRAGGLLDSKDIQIDIELETVLARD